MMRPYVESITVAYSPRSSPSIAVSPNGDCYASGGEDGFVRVHHFDESYFRGKPYGDLEIED